MLVVALSFVVPPVAAPAQEAEALRRELEQMRQQFERVQAEYREAMETMAARLQRLEAAPGRAAAQPVVVQAPPASEPLRLEDLVRPRQPFSLYGGRRPGQLLFDIGVAADFIANITQDNVDRADAGTFTGRENRVFPREIELSLFGQIDPYARGEVRIEAAEEFEDGEREVHVGLAEAHLTLLTLPWGTQAKLGLMRSRFGLLNQIHAHDLPQPDRPNVLVRFLGEEGLVESGGELSWVAPTPFYLEALVGVFNGDNEASFGRGSLRHPLLTGRVRTFLDLGAFGAVQLGGYTPEGWQHALVTLAGEALMSRRDATVVGDPDGDGIESTETRRRNRFGWYAYAEVQPWRRWLGGVRYDNTQFPVDPGREWAVEPYVAFMPSEFLRFRLAYKHTERSHRHGFNDGGASARVLDELFLQATFLLGAHPVHGF
jgi:hypothetical protein